MWEGKQSVSVWSHLQVNKQLRTMFINIYITFTFTFTNCVYHFLLQLKWIRFHCILKWMGFSYSLQGFNSIIILAAQKKWWSIYIICSYDLKHVNVCNCTIIMNPHTKHRLSFPNSLPRIPCDTIECKISWRCECVGTCGCSLHVNER